MIRVLIVDDHAFVRSMMAGVLSAVDDITVVGQCADGIDVNAAAASSRPDVVLMDVRMPRMSGPLATRGLLTVQPEVRVLMLTGSFSRQSMSEAAAAGAAGYLIKGDNAANLVTAVRVVAGGGTAWPGQPTEPTDAGWRSPQAG